MSGKTVGITIRAFDKASATVQRINRKIDTMAEPAVRVGRSFGQLREAVNNNRLLKGLDRISDRTRRIGENMSRMVSLPILGGGALMMRTAVGFDQAMNEVEAVSQAPMEAMKALREQAKLLGSETAFSASEAAGGMAFLARAGWDADQILSGMPDMLNLASATGTSLERVADVASNIMGAFNLPATEAGRIADVLAGVTASANVDINQLAESMKHAAPIAAQYGLSVEETAAAVGLLGNVGLQGGVAGTAVKNLMLGLTAPSSESAKALSALGVNATDAEGNTRNLTDVLTELGGRLSDLGSGEQQAALAKIFGREGLSGATELIKQARTGELAKYQEEVSNLEGRALSMAQIMMKGAPGAMKGFVSAMEALSIAIAESGILESITEVTRGVTEFLRELSRTNPEVLDLGVKIALAAAAIGPLLIGVGFAFKGLRVLGAAALYAAPLITGVKWAVHLLSLAIRANPIGAIITALIGLGYVLYTQWDHIVAYFKDKFAAIGQAFNDGFWNGIVTAFMEFHPITLLSDAFYGLLDWITGMDTKAATAAFIDNMLAGLKTFWDAIPGWFEERWQAITDWLSGISLEGVGETIVQSLLDGLKSDWESVTGWLQDKIDALSALVPDWMKGPDAEGRAARGDLPPSAGLPPYRGTSTPGVTAQGPLAQMRGLRPGAGVTATVKAAGRPAGALTATVPGPSGMSLPAVPQGGAKVERIDVGTVESRTSQNTRIDAPVNVNLTVNGLAEVDVVRREAEAATRRALAEWERRQENAASGALYD